MAQSDAYHSGGILITLVPEDLNDTRRLFEQGVLNARWNTLALTGPGTSAFSPDAEVEISLRSALRRAIDGKQQPATWGAWGGDVAMLHGVQTGKAGFTATIPWILGNSTHRMRVIEVSEDETRVWRGEKAVSFKPVR